MSVTQPPRWRFDVYGPDEDWWIVRSADNRVLVRGKLGDDREADCRDLVANANSWIALWAHVDDEVM